jgi:hypothetical protein
MPSGRRKKLLEEEEDGVETTVGAGSFSGAGVG